MMQVTLSEEEKHRLMAVLRELDPAAPKEKRSGPRRKVLLRIWIRRIVKGKATGLQKVVLVDVSRKGLAILTPQELEVGDKVVAPLQFGEGGGWLTLCEVRNCRQVAGVPQWKVGLQFLERIEDTDGKARIPGDWLG
ncbi:MAG: PilZ domain-containing protein [Phycisphaerae bacterium]